MRLIGKIEIGGMVNEIKLSTKEEAGDHLDRHDEGAHDPYSGTIYVAQEKGEHLNPSRVRDIIVHETIHAAFEGTAARHLLQGETGLRGDAYSAFEEGIVRALTPAIVSAIPGLLDTVGSLPALAKKLSGVK